MAKSRRHGKRRKPKRVQNQSSLLRDEFDDLIRGMCGGFLFGMPVLYTMEVWWIGSSISPPRLVAVLLATLMVTYWMSSTAGFRKAQATTRQEAFGDAVEAIALGLVCAGITMVILRQITFNTHLSEAIGKIILESVPFSLGVALSNQFLSGSKEKSSSSQQASQGPSQEQSQEQPRASETAKKLEQFFPENNLNETITDTSATLLGAIVLAFSLAPTDEIDVLVAAIDGPWLLAIVVISLLLSYSIVFQANFTRQGQRRLQEGLLQGPLSETVFSYLLSLLMAGLMLSFFQKLDLTAPLDTAFRQILILGLPATIGGAAGRLVI